MKLIIALSALLGLGALGCAHAPTEPGARADLRSDAHKTLHEMQKRDPTLRPVIDSSVAYIVFPKVGQGGFLVGGGSGNGVLFEPGGGTQFAELRQLDAGALVGGQSYSEVVVVKDRKALEDLRTGRYDFSAKASAMIVRTGTAAQATFENGVAVFVMPIHGAMVNASIGGQRIRLTL